MTCPEISLTNKLRVFEDKGVLGNLGVWLMLECGILKMRRTRAETNTTFFFIILLLLRVTDGFDFILLILIEGIVYITVLDAVNRKKICEKKA
jgi:hypothetical protein